MKVFAKVLCVEILPHTTNDKLMDFEIIRCGIKSYYKDISPLLHRQKYIAEGGPTGVPIDNMLGYIRLYMSDRKLNNEIANSLKLCYPHVEYSYDED